MPIPANVVPVLVASPGDLRAERNALQQLMWDFNDEHALSLNVVLLPVLWETHSRPQVGAHPQDAIDKQLLQTVDLVVALFWTRIGSLLPDGTPATVHAIDKHVASGKPALIYFSNTPVQPASIVPEQWKAVQNYKEGIRSTSLFKEFDGIDDLTNKLRRDLLAVVRNDLELQVPDVAAIRPSGAIIRCSTHSEHRTRNGRDQQLHYLVVTNSGSATAKNVRLSWIDQDETDRYNRPPEIMDMDAGVDYLASGTSVTFAVTISFENALTGNLEVQWEDEAGRLQSIRQTVRF